MTKEYQKAERRLREQAVTVGDADLRIKLQQVEEQLHLANVDQLNTQAELQQAQEELEAVRKQAKKAWARVKGTKAYIAHADCGPKCNAENCAIFAMEAALDALEVK